MRYTATAATLIAGLVLVTGCSGSNSGPAKSTPRGLNAEIVSTEPDPARSAAPLAGMSALQIWEKTKADADETRSVHVAARFLDGEQINLKMTDAGKVFGVLKIRGDRVLVRRLGRTLYVNAGRRFWTRNTDADTATKLAAKWITVKKGSSSDLQQFFQLTDMDFIVSDIMSLSAAEQQTLKLVPGIDIGRHKTVGLAESDPTEAERQTLYLSATDPALPLNLTFSDSDQFMKFRQWNQDFTVVAPRGAIDLTSAR